MPAPLTADTAVLAIIQIQNGSLAWSDEADGGRGRGGGEASRDFAKLYELDGDPKRKEFLDDLFTFMQKRGRITRTTLCQWILIINSQKLKPDRPVPRGREGVMGELLQYMKYLYPYECEKKGLSSPVELQAAIDSNRREGRRPSYTSTLFGYSPTPSGAPHILSPPKMHLPNNGLHLSPGQPMKKGTAPRVASDVQRSAVLSELLNTGPD
ncbi:AT-rich interactive domain-containing protein 3B [Acipenser ruthenus]|uniref:AT-rich interactive domain-containing protein 3 n=1 Tax=Acipenser ruthenus TaxID=7906 RepID=A0A444UI28_ACIRT|nr:AT-rich interactive domain-containing protein 3B [Acipenser ruthenus]